MSYFDKTRKALLDEYKTSPTAGTSKEWTEVDERTHPRQNTFDQLYEVGRFPVWIRNIGHHTDERDEGFDDGWETNPRPIGYNRPRAEEEYIDALSEFFDTHIALWPGTDSQREYLRVLMTDRRSTRDLAEVGGVSQPAIVLGRQRAVDSFVKHMGGKAALAEKLRTYLHDRETQDGRDRLKYLPRWIHG